MTTINTSNYVSPLTSTQGVQTTPQVQGASDPDGDGDGGGRAHKSHGRGGQMQQAMMQALQSLGLSMPQQAAGSSASSQANSSKDADGDSDGSTSATSNVKKDLRQFMHALFQAVKTEKTSSSSTTDASSADPKANFAAGLSALISQVSNGSAPSDLQSAFSKLASDLQPANATSTSSANASSSGAGTTQQATLQALLTQLQQNLGYGSSSMASTGNVISTYA